MELTDKEIINEYTEYIKLKEFPCIAAKASVSRDNVKCMVVGNMACPKDDESILQFIYEFVDEYRNSTDLYHSAAIIFSGPINMNEEMFDALLWQRLQALQTLDAKTYNYDGRVAADPSSEKFSFSIKEEAFYIIGLHPNSSRLSRRFTYPTLVFNPHAQFEELRSKIKYENMKNVVRKRDIAFSGSINPMLNDFGESSEVYQYSGREYDDKWECPLKISHATYEHNPTP